MMRRQYLGDEKDAFKWDYHNFLIRELGYSSLSILLMLTKDNDKKPNDGKSKPRGFKCADERIYSLCDELKKSKKEDWKFLELIKEMPARMNENYTVRFHAAKTIFNYSARNDYFDSFEGSQQDELIFVDPNTGFEPGTATCDHVKYADINKLFSKISEDSIISVFQYLPRKKIADVYKNIRKQISCNCYVNGLYWSGKLMFVVIGKNKKRIEQVRTINECYKSQRPVELINL